MCYPTNSSQDGPDALVAPCGVGAGGARDEKKHLAPLRAGCVVIRRSPVEGNVEVLLVSRRRSQASFTIPAGKVEKDLDAGSLEACALRETREEAGVEGEVILDLGWCHGQAKDTSKTGRTRFFAMRCLQELSVWQEGAERKRCWYRFSEAQKLVQYNQSLVELLRRAEKSVSMDGLQGNACLQDRHLSN